MAYGTVNVNEGLVTHRRTENGIWL